MSDEPFLYLFSGFCLELKMGFEIRERDMLGRIGRLETKSGTIETPLLFPVINPSIQLIPPKHIREVFDFEAVITNAYLLMKKFGEQTVRQGLHRFLDFQGVIMTDSGAYQILVYGGVETTPREIVEYQENIDTDVATILDYPTGWGATREHAERTVNTTLKRARELHKTKTRNDILWVGPIQGGQYLDLVTKSSEKMAKLPFEIYALGSPTQIMQQYRFDLLLDMIMAAKTSLPIEKPLHLFGAGHPFMFSLAVASGCDLFDSAAYAIYAREDRYMTEQGTYKLGNLEYFPCSCPKCTKADPEEIKQMPKSKKQTFLAEHNLFVCQAEIKRVKQALREGRMWELLQMRAHAHPKLFHALSRLRKYEEYLEKHTPVTKKRGIFFFNSADLVRPEVVRHRKRLTQRYSPPKEAKIGLLMPQTQTKPSHKSKSFQEVTKVLQKVFGEHLDKIHVCFYAAPFGIIPIELDEVYPLSQHETVLPSDRETIQYVARQVENYIKRTNYETIVLVHDHESWKDEVLDICRATCNKEDIKFHYLNIEEIQSETVLSSFEKILQKMLSEEP